MKIEQFISSFNTKGSPKENYRDAFETDITDENCIYMRYDDVNPCFMDRIRIYTDVNGKKIVEKRKSYGDWSLRADVETVWKPINAPMQFERISN